VLIAVKYCGNRPSINDSLSFVVVAFAHSFVVVVVRYSFTVVRALLLFAGILLLRALLFVLFEGFLLLSALLFLPSFLLLHFCCFCLVSCYYSSVVLFSFLLLQLCCLV
jgi:hypothetical protein